MKPKPQPWWLLVGIAVCTAAQAAPQQSPVSAAPSPQAIPADSKAAIDPRTGKLRPLTQEERQQLSLQEQAARKARRTEPLGVGKKGFVAPATEAEAQAGQRRMPTGGAMQPVPESSMTDLTIHRDANGQLVIQHAGQDGDAQTPPQKEWADE